MVTLRDICETRGVAVVADELGCTADHLYKLRRRERSIGGPLLRRCVDVYGTLFDAQATLADMRVDGAA